jgi:ribosomal protein S14
MSTGPLPSRGEHPRDEAPANRLCDFPPDQFSIAVTCEHCGRDHWLDRSTVPEEVTIPALRSRLRCQACGRKEASIRIVYVAAGGFRVGYEAPVQPVDDPQDSRDP